MVLVLMYLVSVGVVCLVLVHIVFCCLATSGSVPFFFLPPLPTQRKGPRELKEITAESTVCAFLLTFDSGHLIMSVSLRVTKSYGWSDA